MLSNNASKPAEARRGRSIAGLVFLTLLAVVGMTGFVVRQAQDQDGFLNPAEPRQEVLPLVASAGVAVFGPSLLDSATFIIGAVAAAQSMAAPTGDVILKVTNSLCNVKMVRDDKWFGGEGSINTGCKDVGPGSEMSCSWKGTRFTGTVRRVESWYLTDFQGNRLGVHVEVSVGNAFLTGNMIQVIVGKRTTRRFSQSNADQWAQSVSVNSMSACVGDSGMDMCPLSYSEGMEGDTMGRGKAGDKLNLVYSENGKSVFRFTSDTVPTVSDNINMHLILQMADEVFVFGNGERCIDPSKDRLTLKVSNNFIANSGMQMDRMCDRVTRGTFESSGNIITVKGSTTDLIKPTEVGTLGYVRYRFSKKNALSLQHASGGPDAMHLDVYFYTGVDGNRVAVVQRWLKSENSPCSEYYLKRFINGDYADKAGTEGIFPQMILCRTMRSAGTGNSGVCQWCWNGLGADARVSIGSGITPTITVDVSPSNNCAKKPAVPLRYQAGKAKFKMSRLCTKMVYGSGLTNCAADTAPAYSKLPQAMKCSWPPVAQSGLLGYVRFKFNDAASPVNKGTGLVVLDVYAQYMGTQLITKSAVRRVTDTATNRQCPVSFLREFRDDKVATASTVLAYQNGDAAIDWCYDQKMSLAAKIAVVGSNGAIKIYMDEGGRCAV